MTIGTYDRFCLRSGNPGEWQHVHFLEHAKDTRKSRTHRHFVKAHPFASFIQQNIDANFLGFLAQTAIAQRACQDDRGTENMRQLHGVTVIGRYAHLRQVGAVNGSRM